MTAPAGGFRLKLTPRAEEQRDWLKGSNTRRYKKVIKALRLLRDNPAYPGLNAHKFEGLRATAPDGGDIWVAYVENSTPSAWRIFFFYDSRDPGLIYVTSIEPHS